MVGSSSPAPSSITLFMVVAVLAVGLGLVTQVLSSDAHPVSGTVHRVSGSPGPSAPGSGGGTSGNQSGGSGGPSGGNGTAAPNSSSGSGGGGGSGGSSSNPNGSSGTNSSGNSTNPGNSTGGNGTGTGSGGAGGGGTGNGSSPPTGNTSGSGGTGNSSAGAGPGGTGGSSGPTPTPKTPTPPPTVHLPGTVLSVLLVALLIGAVGGALLVGIALDRRPFGPSRRRAPATGGSGGAGPGPGPEEASPHGAPALGASADRAADPRRRILQEYERFLRSAAHRLADDLKPLTPNEVAVVARGSWGRPVGPQLDEISRTFEEARYSPHPIASTQADRFHSVLLEVLGTAAPVRGAR